MNWRRGFFRLWVILSAVWFILGSFILIQQIRTLDSPVSLHPDPGGLVQEFPGDTSRDQMHKALATYYKERATKTPAPPAGSRFFELRTEDGGKFQVTAPTIESALNAARTYSGSEVTAVQLIDHPTPNVDPANYDKMIDQMMVGYEPRTVGGMLFGFLKFAVGPPAGLFFLGLMMMWVGSGFRHNIT